MKSDINSWALVVVDPDSGYITDVYVVAPDSQGADIVLGAVARISRPGCWRWIKKLIKRRIRRR